MSLEEYMQRYPELLEGVIKAITREELRSMMSGKHNPDRFMSVMPKVLRAVADKIDKRYKDAENDGRSSSCKAGKN